MAVKMEFEETADINYYKSTNQIHLLRILWEGRELGPVNGFDFVLAGSNEVLERGLGCQNSHGNWKYILT